MTCTNLILTAIEYTLYSFSIRWNKKRFEEEKIRIQKFLAALCSGWQAAVAVGRQAGNFVWQREKDK